MGTFPVHHADGCPPCPALSRPSRVLTHPMLSSSQVLERLRSRRRLQGGDPGGVAGGPGGCSQLAGCTSPCQSQQSRESRACRDRGSGKAGQALGRERSQAGPSPSPLTCHRAQPRLRASAAMNHRTLQGRGCLSTGRASRASAVARNLGSGSSIMTRTERSSEDSPVPGQGHVRGGALHLPAPCHQPPRACPPCGRQPPSPHPSTHQL